MGKLVKKIKSLFIILIILLFNNIVFSQTVSDTSVSFENDTSYFAEPAGTENTSTTTYKAPSTAGMIIKMIVVLALVVAALYGIMLFFKKKNNNVQSDDDFMRRVSSLSFAPGKSVEIVTLVDRCFMLGVTDSNINLIAEIVTLIDRGFILGVTDSNINLIAEITDKEMISALNLNFDKKQNTKKPMNFNDVLEMFMPKSSSKKSIYKNTEQAVENIARAESTDENA